jgi:multicomponent Na+:H+ antiporter subunit F
MILEIVLTMLAAAALIAFVRLLRGPSLPGRVVAIDLIGVLSVGLIVVISAATGVAALLDVAIVIALVSFVGTVAYARYVERMEAP